MPSPANGLVGPAAGSRSRGSTEYRGESSGDASRGHDELPTTTGGLTLLSVRANGSAVSIGRTKSALAISCATLTPTLSPRPSRPAADCCAAEVWRTARVRLTNAVAMMTSSTRIAVTRTIVLPRRARRMLGWVGIDCMLDTPDGCGRWSGQRFGRSTMNWNSRPPSMRPSGSCRRSVMRMALGSGVYGPRLPANGLSCAVSA